MLSEKKEVGEQLLKFNKERIERFNYRRDSLYFQYEKQLHNKKQEMKGNIRVFCRVRPILEEDLQALTSIQQKVQIKPY